MSDTITIPITIQLNALIQANKKTVIQRQNDLNTAVNQVLAQLRPRVLTTSTSPVKYKYCAK